MKRFKLFTEGFNKMKFLGVQDEFLLAIYRMHFKKIKDAGFISMQDVLKKFLIQAPHRAYIFKEMIALDCPELLEEFDKLSTLS